MLSDQNLFRRVDAFLLDRVAQPIANRMAGDEPGQDLASFLIVGWWVFHAGLFALAWSVGHLEWIGLAVATLLAMPAFNVALCMARLSLLQGHPNPLRHALAITRMVAVVVYPAWSFGAVHEALLAGDVAGAILSASNLLFPAALFMACTAAPVRSDAWEEGHGHAHDL